MLCKDGGLNEKLGIYLCFPVNFLNFFSNISQKEGLILRKLEMSVNYVVQSSLILPIFILILLLMV